MSEAGATSRINPWLALWFRPRSAIDAVLSRNWGMISLAIAVAGTVFAVLAGLNDFFHFVDDRLDPTVLALVVSIVLVVALIAVVGYYVGSWLLNAVARLIGGRGSAAETRAAWAWSSVPLLISSLVALAASLGETSHAGATWLNVSTGLIAWICFAWWIVLATVMVARVQKFGLLRGFFSILVGVLGLAAVWAFGIRTLVFQPFSTPSSAMAPTLQIGDYFFASKWAYGYSRYSLPFAPAGFEGRVFAHEPRRGDVVVLRNPKDGTEYVKRIIGLPGDEIQLKRARLFINGNLVERRAVEGASPMRDPMGEPIVAPTYDEYLPSGAVHRIVQIEGDDGEWSNTNVFVTPPGAYFVLGDNRDNSVDSRMDSQGPGFVAFANLVGRAELIYYSVEREPATGRPRPRIDRVGLGVQ